MTTPIHENQDVATAGRDLRQATAAMIMIHGRGATAESILTLSSEFDAPGLAYLAPQAANNTWYPYSFLSPLSQNEPFLSSALATLDALVTHAGAAGIPPEKMVLLGFSQGACLASEYVARHPARYGGLVAFSGGLIGPAGTPRNYQGSLEGLPVFLGCSDVDPHIPAERVQETEQVLQKMGAAVTMRLYPGMGHTVNQDEIDFVQQLLGQMLAESPQ